jgi:hypothetical protein
MLETSSYEPVRSRMPALAFLYDNWSDLPPWVQRLTPGQVEQLAALFTRWTRQSTEPVRPIEEVKKREYLRALAYCRGDVCATAKLLGIGKSTLYRRLKSWGFAALKCHAIEQAAALACICSAGDDARVGPEQRMLSYCDSPK